MHKRLARALLLLTLGIGLATFYSFGLYRYLDISVLQSKREMLSEFVRDYPLLARGVYMLVYIGVTALSLPGAAVLTLAGGALFGFAVGAVMVSFASTIGASLAFLCARFLLRDWVQQQFADRLVAINRGIEKKGSFYLFTLRLIPAVPFFIINLVMGLMPIPLWRFFVISQLGMLPGTLVYVNAGTRLGNLDSLAGILSFELAASFALLAVFPWAANALLAAVEKRRLYGRFVKPKRFEYNLVVIGGGAAGLVSSYIAAAVKAKVALIEKHKMGGDCLNYGCVPSKALIHAAKVAHLSRSSSQLGVSASQVEVDFAKVMAEVQRVIAAIEPHDSPTRYRSLGVECVQGEAKILSPFQVQVGESVLSTKNIVIATGAAPFVPRIPGIERVNVLTSDSFWGLQQLPAKLLIVGAGPIGCELAQAMQRLGSKVCLVEKSPQILSQEDSDVAALVADRLVNEGVEIRCGHQVREFTDARTAVLDPGDGQAVAVEFDAVLIAIGRQARTSGFGLEELGIELNEKGQLAVNEFMQTRYPNIYACGDVVGPMLLTHVAAHQAWYCAVNALFSPFRKFRADYRVIPLCTFTDPQCARVGLSESQARAQNIPFEVHTYGIDDLDRAIADGAAHGMVKVLTRPGSDKILGATSIGEVAGETIIEFVTAMKHNIGLNKILGTVHAYPTHSEANKYVAGVWKKAHAPTALLRWVARYHRWRRRS